MKRRATLRVVAMLGGGKVICARCGCTLADYDTKCSAALNEPCPGFEAIERAEARPRGSKSRRR